MMVVTTMIALCGFSAVTNRYSAPGDEPALAPAANASAPLPTVGTAVLIPNEYDDSMDTLYIFSMGSMSMAALGVYPAWSRAAWAPFAVPLIYLTVTGAYPQPLERFLQVSLSHVLLLSQVRTCARARGHTFPLIDAVAMCEAARTIFD